MNSRPEETKRPRRTGTQRKKTAQTREDILEAAFTTFGSRGYKNGSLAEIAEQVGMTHAGILHHFGSKDQLLLEVLEHRDRTDVRDLEGHHIPDGAELFRHLERTARLNADRPGIVQAFAVLSAEAVTEGHPAKPWFRQRYEELRADVERALHTAWDGDDPIPPKVVDSAAASILAVMDGLQVQWLLSPDDIDLGEMSAFAIEAILRAAIDRSHEPLL